MNRIQVLDHGYVRFIDLWGTDESIIEAARMSTGKGFESWEKDRKLLKYLYTHKHMTPFEMCGAVFEIKAPIFVFREWHRHRTQSYNEMSARYIPIPDENYVPSKERIVEGAKNLKNRQATGVTELNGDLVDHWLKNLERVYAQCEQIYQYGLEIGIPKEVARLSMSVGRYSKMRTSANLRNWMAFLTLRLDETAQWEIRQCAGAVLTLLKNHFPESMTIYLDDQCPF